MNDPASPLDSLLSSFSSHHRTALREACAWIEATLQPEAIVATGSIVRGEGQAGSDLDLVVLWRRPGRQRLQRLFAGVPAEIFANSAAWLRQSIRAQAASGRPVMAHMLATGVVVRDDGGAMVALAAEAARVLRNGPTWSAEDRLRQRYLAACVVEDALDLLPSADGDAILVTHRAVDALLDTAFFSCGEFLPGRKRRLAALRSLDPDAAAAIDAVLQSSPAERRQRLQEASQRILGVPGFFSWESAYDPADPSPDARADPDVT